jgi:FkbM family methyltransferase
MGTIGKFLAKNAPYLGPPKRWSTAFYETVRGPRASYGQHGEDVWLAERWPAQRDCFPAYIDVGANHPMRLSNTYLMYRHGYRGFVVEPNADLASLHRRFRPGDVCISAAVGSNPGVAKFNVSITPVLSSLEKIPQHELLRTDYVPLITLDQLAEAGSVDKLFLLSIDTEGFDVDVLKGARTLLPRTKYICIEAWDDARAQTISDLLSETHKLAKSIKCNLIFENGSG